MPLKTYALNSMISFPQIQVILEKTPLLEVEIDTGDSLPIIQKPYTLPLKHTTWVQRELENIGESWSNSKKCLTLG